MAAAGSPALARFPRDSNGNLTMLGTGRQHWSTVHAADLANVFRRVLEDDSAAGYCVVGDGSNPTVAELTEAAAVASRRARSRPRLGRRSACTAR